MLVAFGSLSKSSVLVRSSIGPFGYFLYFGILLTETAGTNERAATWPSTCSKGNLDVVTPSVTAEREMIFFLLSGRSLFFAYVSPIPVRGLWEFLHILIIIIIQFNFLFFYLFPSALLIATHRQRFCSLKIVVLSFLFFLPLFFVVRECLLGRM